MFGHEEAIIDKPVTPSQVKHLVYATCYPYHPSAAVLQQELLISIGTFMETQPHIFDGMLKIRMGWIVRALSFYITHTAMDPTESKDDYIYSLSPSDVQDLLLEVLTLPPLTKSDAAAHSGKSYP